MRLSPGQNAYLLRCRCGPANLVYSGLEVEFRGQVTCRGCGHRVQWQELLEACDAPKRPSAEIHLLRS